MKTNVFNRVKAQRASGFTWDQIAGNLNDSGYKTPKGKSWTVTNLYASYNAASVKSNRVMTATSAEHTTDATVTATPTTLTLSRDQIVEVLSSNLSKQTKKAVVVATL